MVQEEGLGRTRGGDERRMKGGFGRERVVGAAKDERWWQVPWMRAEVRGSAKMPDEIGVHTRVESIRVVVGS